MNKPLYWIIIFSIALVIVTIFALNGNIDNGPIDPEEYSIYLNVLENYRDRLQVISNFTSLDSSTYNSGSLLEILNSFSCKKYVLSDLSEDTISDFTKKNKTTYLLNTTLFHGTRTKFIDKKQMLKYRSMSFDIFDSTFKKEFPGSTIIKFSRVGFNKKKDQALVFYEQYVGGSWNRFVLFKKVNNKWEYVNEDFLSDPYL